MKTCVSSNITPANVSGKTNKSCIGCPNFNFSASGQNADQTEISSSDKR